EKTDEEKLAELLATAQPQAFPGFIQKGTPEAPYFEPDPSYRPPMQEGEIQPSPVPEEKPAPVPLTALGPDEVPITPQVATQAEGQKQEEQLTRNVEESLDPFARAAQRVRQGVRPD